MRRKSAETNVVKSFGGLEVNINPSSKRRNYGPTNKKPLLGILACRKVNS